MSDLSIEVLYVLPKREDRWVYVINNGGRHLTDTQGVREFIFSLIKPENRPRAIELLATLQRILVIPDSEKQVFKLKNDSNALRERERVENHLAKAMPDKIYQQAVKEAEEQSNTISGDKTTVRFQNLLQKMLPDFGKSRK